MKKASVLIKKAGKLPAVPQKYKIIKFIYTLNSLKVQVCRFHLAHVLF